MRNLNELSEIRDKIKLTLGVRTDDHDNIKVAICMSTCGISSGAREITKVFTSQVSNNHLQNVSITQTGCKGFCNLEPMAEVVMPNGDKTTYVNLTSQKVIEIVQKHIINGQPLVEFTAEASHK